MIHRPSRYEIQRGAVTGKNEDAQQSKQRAGYGIEQIFQTRVDRFLRAVMQDQRDGQQGRELKKHVHCDQIRGVVHGYQRKLGKKEERVKPVPVLTVVHVLCCEKTSEEESGSHDEQKQVADPVQPERDGQGIGHGEERKPAVDRQKPKKSIQEHFQRKGGREQNVLNRTACLFQTGFHNAGAGGDKQHQSQ